MLNGPINKIHLVFDSWKYFSMVEKKCVDSLTPLISTGLTLDHLLQDLLRGRGESQDTGHMAWEIHLDWLVLLWVVAYFSCVPDRPPQSTLCTALWRYVRFLDMLELSGPGGDSPVPQLPCLP